MIGVQHLDWADIFSFSPSAWLVLTTSRFPRLISLILTGVGLAICGVILQHAFQNKFVEPATSGGLDAAKLGILVALVALPQASLLAKAAFAVIFCFLCSLIYIAFIKRLHIQNQILIPVLGLMYGAILSAIAEFYAYHHQIMQSMGGWLLGDFSKVIQGQYELIYLIVPIVVLTYVYAYRFTLLGMGREMAQSLGLKYTFTVSLGLLLVSITVATTVITVGSVPFVGLVIPNLIAIKYGDDLAKTLPLIALSSACLIVLCDIISRLLIYPFEIPIGLTMGMLGGIIFLWIIVRGIK